MPSNYNLMSRPSVRLLNILAAAIVMTSAGCHNVRIGTDISRAQENDMGAKYAAEIEQHVHLETDGKINRRLLDIATPIFVQAAIDRPDVNFKIRIIDDKDINAFSIPGGYIYIYRGLYEKLGSDDDAIACVIAHEAAHVVRRHVVKQMSDEQGKSLLLGVAVIFTRSSTLDEVGSVVADLDQLHFNRVDEYEADRFGEKYAYDAGYDPAGMIRTFNMLKKVDKNSGHRAPYAEDHPITRNRSLRAMEQWRELRANHGCYLSDSYNPNGDRIAATRSGISYSQLVATTADSDGNFGLGLTGASGEGELRSGRSNIIPMTNRSTSTGCPDSAVHTPETRLHSNWWTP